MNQILCRRHKALAICFHKRVLIKNEGWFLYNHHPGLLPFRKMSRIEENTKDRTSIAKEDVPVTPTTPIDLPEVQGRAGSKFTTSRIELWAFYVYYIVRIFLIVPLPRIYTQ